MQFCFYASSKATIVPISDSKFHPFITTGYLIQKGIPKTQVARFRWTRHHWRKIIEAVAYFLSFDREDTRALIF